MFLGMLTRKGNRQYLKAVHELMIKDKDSLLKLVCSEGKVG